MVYDFRYDTKRVVISGCASGIGRATAELLLHFGAEVHGVDLREPDLCLASFTVTDLALPDSISAAVAQIGGRVDALFNCAGVPPTHGKLDVLKVNFLGTRYLTSCVLEHMHEGAAIVSTSSNGGAGWRNHLAELRALLAETTFAAGIAWLEQNLAGIANAYSFSKEALILWTMHESASLIKRGIRINCTSPGAVQTPMLDEIETIVARDVIDAVAQPIDRRSVPLEQAWPLVMLNSDAASYINGADLAVDGGFAAAAPFRP
ncbi:3-alpha-hydroxysteroid dehydrogenase [Acidocella aquatica]|uniref:3-alpha-hydroxysteroid dehydrogenase n=1 Tax=Acidocella aquatica TaxID=1922313 RepID=A0ABQ6AAB6_9PROT|nr:coniferyl-alcohol dehydrogenase [Acidocella aquatica]GLR68232.1 3-alpha-hydroxysteroid dehydrogenase [Acidocella aquatica]